MKYYTVDLNFELTKINTEEKLDQIAKQYKGRSASGGTFFGRKPQRDLQYTFN